MNKKTPADGFRVAEVFDLILEGSKTIFSINSRIQATNKRPFCQRNKKKEQRFFGGVKINL